MAQLLLVMAGGAIGSAARFLFGRGALALVGPGWPWGTLGVNLLGGFAMGGLVALLPRLGADGEGWRLFAGVGVLGGFTTFSAFTLDMATLAADRVGAAVLYALVSVIGAFAALLAGGALVRATAA